MTALQIRPMTPDDVAPAAAMYRAGGWGEREAYMRWAMTVPTCRLLVGVAEGRIVATGLATINGPVGWVGSIFVDVEMRSHGYGRLMTEAACELIDAAGCRTQALIASEFGKPLYDKMGFRVDDEYQIYGVPKLAPGSIVPTAAKRGLPSRPMTSGDLAAVCELDREATGEDRSALIESLAGTGWVVDATPRDGGLRGFLVSTLPDSGALIARAPEAATSLLASLRSTAGEGRPVYATVPLGNEAGRRYLEELGWRPSFRTPRMLRGEPIPWRPEMIWDVLSFAFG
jgi:GNAT superfamily N-acetyltransferase